MHFASLGLFLLGLSESVPANHKHFPFGVSGSLDKVPLSSVYTVVYFSKEMNELHNMIGDDTKRSFSKGGPPSHFKKFGLSANKFIVKIINNKMEVTRGKFLVKDREV